MDTIKIKYIGDKQTINLPQKYNFDEKELYIKKVGNSVVIFPKNIQLESWFENLYNFTDDFMSERVQPEIDKRKNL
ncbi:MAG: type II toxin-antitoxin system VapB family antitoxin [Bacteroidota bacterium]|nr:type II toxin-antitoxin system VapB family antitoxin [Bacteroidota bacterium]